MKVEFSPAAQAELLDIAAFIAQDNPARATTLVDALESQCEALARSPGIGTLRPELGNGIRMLPEGRYLFFYRATSEQLRVERILHSARDIGRVDLDSEGSADA